MKEAGPIPRQSWVIPLAVILILATLGVGGWISNRYAESEAREVCGSVSYEVRSPGRVACLEEGEVISVSDPAPSWPVTLRTSIGIGIAATLICVPWSRVRGRTA
jgi:hypothetical protein